MDPSKELQGTDILVQIRHLRSYEKTAEHQEGVAAHINIESDNPLINIKYTIMIINALNAVIKELNKRIEEINSQTGLNLKPEDVKGKIHYPNQGPPDLDIPSFVKEAFPGMSNEEVLKIKNKILKMDDNDREQLLKDLQKSFENILKGA